MARYLTILEVSQKQAYIFASNKLKDNIVNSEIIAYALSPEYISRILSAQGYTDSQNMVYSGGGHTVLEFTSEEEAGASVASLTEQIYRDFDGLEVFAKTIRYDESAENPVAANLKNLTKELERKKSLRLSAFRQGSYGVEAIDVNTLNVKNLMPGSKEKSELADADSIQKREQSFYPDGFKAVSAFGELGGSKNDKNFIAVVHIDGNGMGKRVEELYKLPEVKDAEWDSAKKKIREFSECVAEDFRSALEETANDLGLALAGGKLNDLAYKIDKEKGSYYFPLRRIITAGDDICFVTEGRIGIECAVRFIKHLEKKENTVDHKNYYASAGVAIVHQKYPFYKAYELAEMLCSSAKKFGSFLSADDNGRTVAAIDWHIEYGELKDSIDEVRKAYLTEDGNRMEMRPYLVAAPKEILEKKELTDRLYSSFKKRIQMIQNDKEAFPVGKIKELRNAIKAGERETDNYLILNRIKDIALDFEVRTELDPAKRKKEYKLFEEQSDGKKHSTIFDAIELMDAFIPLFDGEGD